MNNKDPNKFNDPNNDDESNNGEIRELSVEYYEDLKNLSDFEKMLLNYISRNYKEFNNFVEEQRNLGIAGPNLYDAIRSFVFEKFDNLAGPAIPDLEQLKKSVIIGPYLELKRLYPETTIHREREQRIAIERMMNSGMFNNLGKGL